MGHTQAVACPLWQVLDRCLFPLSLHPPTAAAPKRFEGE